MAEEQTPPATPGVTPPEACRHLLLGDDLEDRMAALIERRALTNGWLVCGPEGIGKATLAFHLARALLDPAAIDPSLGALATPATARTFSLVAAGAHPDLFVARRRVDEKTGRRAAEISVDVVRQLNAFFARTPSIADWRVAIVDTADELNRNAANALLKSLEEPPPRATLFLLSTAPGGLIATIRSRCRRAVLRPVDAPRLSAHLQAAAGVDAETASRLAAAARGRPGLAMRLAAADGVDAIEAADRFIGAALGGDVDPAIAALTKRGADEQWALARAFLLERIDDAVRAAAIGEGDAQTATNGLQGAPTPALLEARDRARALLGRGEALNLDRAALLHATARALREAVRAG